MDLTFSGTSDEPNRPEPTRTGQMSATASNLHQKATLPAEKFKYRGRSWRMFKRSAEPDASWYLYFEANKKRHLFSLGSASKTHALTEAKLKIDLHFAGRADALRASMARPNVKTFSKLRDIIGTADGASRGVLLTMPTKKMAGIETRLDYGWSLRWVLRTALNVTDEEIDALPASVISKETARKFFDTVATRAAALPNQAAANAFLRSAHSNFNKARALFAPRALEAMRETFQLTLPELAGWRDARKTYAQAVPEGNDCQLPSDAVIRRTLREWIRIAETPGYRLPGGDRRRCDGIPGHELPPMPLCEVDRRNLFVTIGLELACGLRVSETKIMRRHWITTEAGLPLVRCTDTHAKNRTGKIEVSPLNPFWKILWFWIEKNGWDVPPESYILTERPTARGRPDSDARGGATDRTHHPENNCSRWLRWLGWQTQKTNHALRDFSASMITMRYGLGEACDWCRHSSIATTERHYSRFVKLSKRIEAKKLAWIRWAR